MMGLQTLKKQQGGNIALTPPIISDKGSFETIWKLLKMLFCIIDADAIIFQQKYF